MQWRQNLLSLGFILMAIGAVLLLVTSTSSEGSVFFIFPFFFFGSSSIFGLAFFIILALVFFIVVLRMSSMAANYTDSSTNLNVQDNFIPIGSRCVYCSKPIPIKSSFCPFCGNLVEENEGSANRI